MKVDETSCIQLFILNLVGFEGIIILNIQTKSNNSAKFAKERFAVYRNNVYFCKPNVETRVEYHTKRIYEDQFIEIIAKERGYQATGIDGAR